MKGIDVKGKEYVEVNKRVLAFRKLYPEGTIRTEILNCNDGIVCMKAEVLNGDLLLATGHAYEKESSSFINKTSYIENCETSAIGRALGMLGIGIATSIASYEEVGNAMIQQNAEPEKITAKEAKVLMDALNALPKQVNIDELCKRYKVANLKELTTEQYSDILRKVKKSNEKQS